MARHTSRVGIATMVATSLRGALRPGSAGLGERAAAVPRMLRAVARGEYRGTTFSHVALLAAAVAYVVSPMDVMPEAFFAVFGIADDAVVVAWLVAALVNDTEAFLEWERTVGRPSADRPSRSRAAGSAPAGAGAPQDMSSDEWAHKVRSQVVR